MIIHAAYQVHCNESAKRKADLFIKVCELAVVLRLFQRKHFSRPVDHQRAKQGQRSSNAEHEPIHSPFFRHIHAVAASTDNAPTACLNTSPRSSKLLNISKLAQAGASSTLSPG